MKVEEEELESCSRIHLFALMKLTSLSSPPPPPSSSSAMDYSKSCSDEADGTWDYFPCPYCSVEVEVPVLCAHLQEEHCFDVKNAVCPVCAANPGKDMIEHMTVQHSYLLKRRKSQRTNLWTSNLESIQRESYGSTSFVGAATGKKGDSSDSAPDPLLSSFINNSSFEDGKSQHEANFDAVTDEPSTLHVQSLDPSIFSQVLGQNYEMRSQIASFVQEMLLSTIF